MKFLLLKSYLKSLVMCNSIVMGTLYIFVVPEDRSSAEFMGTLFVFAVACNLFLVPVMTVPIYEFNRLTPPRVSILAMLKEGIITIDFGEEVWDNDTNRVLHRGCRYDFSKSPHKLCMWVDDNARRWIGYEDGYGNPLHITSKVMQIATGKVY